MGYIDLMAQSACIAHELMYDILGAGIGSLCQTIQQIHLLHNWLSLADILQNAISQYH